MRFAAPPAGVPGGYRPCKLTRRLPPNLRGDRRFKASHASHCWEAVNNRMWPDKPVRQAREPSEEFVSWNIPVSPRNYY